MPRMYRIVLSLLVSLGVIVGIYTSVESLSAGASRATIGSHPVNIYSRSFSDSSTTKNSSLQTMQGDPSGHGGCHSDYQQTAPDD
jgi:hypothetical protein